MAKNNKVSMPSSTAGITRYFDEYKSKIEFTPGHIIILCLLVIVILVLLIGAGSALVLTLRSQRANLLQATQNTLSLNTDMLVTVIRSITEPVFCVLKNTHRRGRSAGRRSRRTG